MDNDIQARFDAIDRRLKAIEGLAEELKESIDSISTDVLGADQLSGTGRKLDEILEILKGEQ